ncbi:FtsX-like permease family protein [Aporhodopirellula aestuarii]|uniref:FtsX-like permease family protein n=1 Tax=Aporhodopirellula aestuarii TaxID=2950107 RepID=A0ABT0TY04_9BACT|nr:FtsX-like permease family protein [Aporhodopirellula aestuarii]MCM2369143.1 FtsX-like permease family protein [Aporhodopirellula aestuarii]
MSPRPSSESGSQAAESVERATLSYGRSPRRTSLAWKNLTDAPIRTTVSLSGIGFAILLMFMQLGFLGSVGDTATVVFNRMDCDVVVRSQDYLHLYDPSSLPGDLPQWLEGLPEVRQVVPLDIGVTQWQNPLDHSFRAIALMGIDLDEPAFDLPELTPATRAQLRPTGAVLIDDASTDDFGPSDGIKFGPADIGRTTDVAGSQATVKGTFEMGTGLAANGALLSSRETFEELTPGRRGNRVSLILVTLEDSENVEAGLNAIKQRLRSLGGPASQAHAMTLNEVMKAERLQWYFQTPIGLIFGIGVVLAVVVGGVISYMVLASDLSSHLSEYATLKAIGYSNGYLVRTLLTQSTLLAILAFPPSLLMAYVLYYLTSHYSHIPIRMTTTWMFLVLGLSLLMCNAAGVFALRKLLKAEPASLF